jgi:hypothetical protein
MEAIGNIRLFSSYVIYQLSEPRFGLRFLAIGRKDSREYHKAFIRKSSF